jgi:site-specific recombinase XerD
MHKDDLPLEHFVDAYQLFNRAVGKSAATLRWYESRLGHFCGFLGESPTLGDLTTDAARMYIVHLQGRTDRHAGSPFVEEPKGKLSTAYIHGCVRAMRAFASWLEAEGHTETHRLKAVKPPKIQQKVIPVLNDEEVQKLLGRFNREDPVGARNYAMVLTLLDCGLRASELSGLRLADAYLKEGYLKVLGKGNKERLVPLGTAAQKALLAWRDFHRPQFEPGDCESLFLTVGGYGLTTQALEEVVKRAAKSSGVPRVYCHLLRHTFATNYLVREVGDPFRLQQILGHTSLEMVRHYVGMANVQASLLERRASPMDLMLAASERPNSRQSKPPVSKVRRKHVGGEEGGRVSLSKGYLRV